jgi:hypothetical protein
MSTNELTRRNVLQSLIALGASPIAIAGAGQGSVSAATLFARWACTLNHLGWPEDWGIPPQEVSAMMKMRGREQFLEHERLGFSTLVEALRAAATEKEYSRVWNVERYKTMSAEYFEEWWADRQSLSPDEFHEKHYGRRRTL